MQLWENDDFDSRNILKKEIHCNSNSLYFNEWDVRRASIWKNVKSEVYWKWESFRRPVLVFKKLSSELCVCIPLSTKPKKWTRFCQYQLWDEFWTALLYQIKTLHINRFQRKIWKIDKTTYLSIKKNLKLLLDLYSRE
jgi:mRNA interferase MazF